MTVHFEADFPVLTTNPIREMTMTTDNQTPSLATFDETMQALREGRASHPIHSFKIHGADEIQSARATVPGAVLEAGDDDALAAQRAAAGVSLAAVETDIAAISKRVGYLNEQLGRVVHDRRTGQPVSILPEHLVAAHRTELAGLQEELATAHKTRQAVLQRKAAEAVKQREIDEVESAEQEWVGHSPARAKLLQEAKERLEAEQLAAWSLGKRYRIG